MTALSKQFYPVIHCLEPEYPQSFNHAVDNTLTALNNEADGVFLIGHGVSSSDLIEIYQHVRGKFPDAWLGINFLGISPQKWHTLYSVSLYCDGLNALWTDGMPDYSLPLHPSIQIFGGVAFKYLASDIVGDELTRACEAAVRHVNVATTSGEATGSPPSLEKLKAIKEALDGRIPLALASWVNEDNVVSFKPFVDTFLVASSICEKNPITGIEDLVPLKVARLGQLIHA